MTTITKDTEVQEEKSLFTAKEEQVMKVAWLCLKSGPPDIDVQRLVSLGGFNTAKTASNTWGVIKKKLLTLVDGEGFTPAATVNSADTKKRAAKAVDDADDNAEVTPAKKKGRKSPTKKAKADADAEQDAVDAQFENDHHMPTQEEVAVA